MTWFFFGPAGLLAGLLISFIAARRLGAGLVVGLGFVLALIVFMLAYLAAPTTYEETGGCPDCGEYLGRWWEPWLVAYSLVLNLLGWMMGVAAGRRLRRR
jgi:hypothetical protein